MNDAVDAMLFALQLAFILFASALAWEGVKALRGVPDRTGRVTARPMAAVLLVFAAGLLISAFAILPVFKN